MLMAPALVAASENETPSSRAQLSLDDLRTFTDVFNQVRSNTDFSSEVSAADDYMMYQALILLKGNSLLGRTIHE